MMNIGGIINTCGSHKGLFTEQLSVIDHNNITTNDFEAVANFINVLLCLFYKMKRIAESKKSIVICSCGT